MAKFGLQPKFSITNALTKGLTQLERARAIGERAPVLEAHHTTHFEGTQLKLEQAARLWRGEKVPEADPNDVRKLLNYRKAFEFVSDYLDSGTPIAEGLIREIHKRLVDEVGGGQATPGQ